MTRLFALLAAIALLVVGCGKTISGTATWPGATLNKVLLTEADFPPGVLYGRIGEDPGVPDNAGAPPSMLSIPQGCSNGLTGVIAAYAERGPGAAAKYGVTYSGVRIVMTVLTSALNLDGLATEATRCQSFNVFFDRNSAAIPMTTTRLASRPDQLVYAQTMNLQGNDTTVYMSFENVGRMAVFGMGLPTIQISTGQPPPPNGSLPQTFTEIADRQAQRIHDS
ncbi:MAG: hypothetical protein JO280_13995 [Mycobacteriaceae bacterium]|nr:hypothetical protein [Mycobacteriaceae bacterium]